MSYKTICQYEILSQPVAPVPGVPYVEQGFFLQLYNYSGSPVTIVVFFVSRPPIDPKSSGALRFGANLIKNNGAPMQVVVNQQDNAIFFPQETLQPSDCFLFGIKYYLQPKMSTNKLGTTPMENASSRGIVQLMHDERSDVTSLKGLATIRQVFTSYDAAGNATDVSSSAYAVPSFYTY